MIDDVRNTVLAIANKNNYGYISPQDFNLYCQQAQMDMFEDYFYQYNNWITKQNQRVSGSGYADIVKNLEEVIDFFSQEVFLTQVGVANTYTLPTDYYLINKLFYYPNSLATGTNTFVAAFKLTDSAASFSNLTNPTTPQIYRSKPEKFAPELLLYSLDKPTNVSVTGYIIINDVMAVTIKPLYKAPIIFLLFPNLTNQVPIIEVIIHAPPIVKG